jgi:hypothetical protein
VSKRERKPKPVTLEELAERVAALEAHNGWCAPAETTDEPGDNPSDGPADGDKPKE